MIKLLKKIRYRFLELLLSIKSKFKRQPDVKNEKDKLFFILGSGRNGSTLLARLLNQHDDVFLPPEQYALPYTIADKHVSLFQSWSNYLQKQIGRYKRNNQNWKLPAADFEKIEEKVADIEPAKRTPRTLFKHVFKQYAYRFGNGETVLGDHSPITTVFYKFIGHEFANDRFIFLIRHPFDVILSYSKMPNNPASDPIEASKKWNHSIDAYDYLKERDCDILLVKYEELVTKPKQITEKILDHIDLEQQDIVDPPEEAETVDPLGASDLEHHKKLYQPVDAKSVGKWKKKLDPDIIEQTAELVQENAERFGYKLEA